METSLNSNNAILSILSYLILSYLILDFSDILCKISSKLLVVSRDRKRGRSGVINDASF